ncbi:MAG: 50S ribosomal protein L29 [Candidatus Nanohaloarchaea archaeon]|nr:50S ribosomal protein L29 [Candidatus Nanohaloarchaea archaeon]
MVILRADEIRDMNPDEREEKLDDLQLEIAEEKGQSAIGGFPENPGRIKEVRKTIARIKTIQNEEKSQQAEEAGN